MPFPDANSTVSSGTLLNARRGDDDAWKSIWSRYSDRVFRQALRFGISESDAEDVTVDVFEKVWEKLDDFSRNGRQQSLGAWINRITQTSVLDHLRKRRRDMSDLGSRIGLVASQGDTEDDESGEVSPVWLALWRALGTVENEESERNWECFRMARFANLPHSEIVEKLGMPSVSSVSTQSNRVFNKIRDEAERQLKLMGFAVDLNGDICKPDRNGR